MARILIADDHPIVRRGLKQILAEEPDFTHVGEAQSAREVHEQIREARWDVLILDINLPDQSGLEVLREVREHKPNLPILILSMHPEDQFALRVLKSGASGYLTKDSAPDELIKAVRKILSGGRYVSATLAEQLAASLSGAAPETPHQTLTDREFQVLCLIASGKTVSEIAAHLDLSVKTISTYRTRLLEKMNLKTNAEITSYAVRQGLVE